jgi:hypothetical protein
MSASALPLNSGRLPVILLDQTIEHPLKPSDCMMDDMFHSVPPCFATCKIGITRRTMFAMVVKGEWLKPIRVRPMGEKNLSESIIVNTVVEPTSDVSDCDIYTLLFPFRCNTTNVIVQVACQFL